MAQLRFFYNIYGRHVTGLSIHVVETRVRPRPGCATGSDTAATAAAAAASGGSGGSEESRRGEPSTSTRCRPTIDGGGLVYRNYRVIRLPAVNWDGQRDDWRRAAVVLPYLTRR